MRAIMNKYRNELGRAHRKEYESGVRNEWCNPLLCAPISVGPTKRAAR